MVNNYSCNSCQTQMNEKATVCSNSTCRANLAFCSFCRSISTYVIVEERNKFFTRSIYRCERCQNLGVKCLTWLSGGYCNGLARSGKSMDRPFCPSCSSKATEVIRSIVSWSIIGAVGGLIRRK